MKCFFDARQREHAPAVELHNGTYIAYSEAAGRVDSILDRLGPVLAPADYGLAPIEQVHDAGYLQFLRTAHEQWRAAGRSGDAAGYVWPVVRRRPLDLQRIDAQLGRYSFDAASPITEATWTSAYWAAQTALAAVHAVLAGEPAAFALCRPPGHHAGADYLGGYCFLNNVAIAAQAAREAGRARIAILDVDYHHGNGTQDIFYERDDVLFVSIHADPATDYPFYWGHADERGEGAGLGCNLNIPLPRGTTLAGYQAAVGIAARAIADFGPDVLLISLGVDTFEADPISEFKLKSEDFPLVAQQIAALGLPTVIVMEGGYATDALGDNVSRFLRGFISRRP
ncbi:MAG: histone deacetylase family protein [Caulobacteraceae bacterium]